MKKFFGLTAVIVLILLLASCNGEDKTTSDGDIEAVESDGVADGDMDMDGEFVGADAEDSDNYEKSDSGGCMVDGDSAAADSDSDDVAGDTDASESAESAELSDSGESDSQSDGDAEALNGEDENDTATGDCPSDMVRINDYCIDRYEASRPDATAYDPGDDESQATSRYGVLPWHVNPMNQAHLSEFEAACDAAGKHLCTAEEWFEGCNGPDNTTYVWGNTFDRETCNCVDTYCDDYCTANGIPSGNCNTAANCGYACGASSRASCFHVAPTGSFDNCTNDYGTFDINGNVWEIVPVSADVDARGYMIRGGAFNCAGASDRLQCTYNASWDALFAGFRCCKTLD